MYPSAVHIATTLHPRPITSRVSHSFVRFNPMAPRGLEVSLQPANVPWDPIRRGEIYLISILQMKVGYKVRIQIGFRDFCLSSGILQSERRKDQRLPQIFSTTGPGYSPLVIYVFCQQTSVIIPQLCCVIGLRKTCVMHSSICHVPVHFFG